MERTAVSACRLFLAIALAAVGPALAFAKSGEFTFVVGEVTLAKADGQRSRPARGTTVDAGDRITTGADGMVQMTMVDNARLSLRPKSEFVVEQYGKTAKGEEGGVLNLVKGTLRTFTGAIAQTNRENFVMKTRVATVGIRGSGNILYACEGGECDTSVTGGQQVDGALAVNHTIEGAHAVTNIVAGAVPGLPAQQGGAQTLISGPGQTVLAMSNQPPKFIPTPAFIMESATNMTGGAAAAEARSAAQSSGDETRNFAPGDAPALPAAQQTTIATLNTTPGFHTIDAAGNLGADPARLHDVIIASGSAFLGQAVRDEVVLVDNNLRGYRSYAGTLSQVQPTISGGALREGAAVSVQGANIVYGRWDNASLGFFGAGSETRLPGSIHWIMAPSGFPTFLSDVLTGSATYTLAFATAPTNQENGAGTFGPASLNVNFSNRTLGLQASVAMPTGNWQLSADNVPISLNTFYGSTSDRLVITNGAGQTSRSNSNLTGSFEGSFVGTGLGAAILGYGINDLTAPTSGRWQFVTGVAAFSGPRQDAAAP
ncbi:MAG TPA: FecR domain-containing protein, partial [Usitatibacter sp.]|nr:FecR domain-containing protein [Usitatibacter sp.]